VKVVRIIQLLVVIALIGYLLLLHNVNPQTVILPFLFSFPTAVVVAAALALGFLVGWLSGLGRVWRLGRENRRLRQQLIKLGGTAETPVIPDREAAERPRGQLSRSNSSSSTKEPLR